MLDHTIQWLRAYYQQKVKHLPTKKDEAYMLRSRSFNRRIIPNVFKKPYFCFSCGVYFDDLKKHDASKIHIRKEGLL
jgi:hypothetical protein